jgi:hypothetical protein
LPKKEFGEGTNMTKILRITVMSISVLCLSILLVVERAQAQSSCLGANVAKEMLSKAGVPTSEVGWLILVLTPDFTAGPEVDQITQTSPEFFDRNSQQLTKEDQDLARAQNFVGSMPLTPDTQKCVNNMQQIRDKIQKELRQRDKENIPDSLSPNQMRGLRTQQVQAATNQHYDRNPMAGGTPRPSTGPGNTGGWENPGQGGGDCGPGVTCSMQQQ